MLDTPKQILEYVGREKAAEALGVTMDRVERATRDPKLPSSWLNALEQLARQPLPRKAFAFKGAA